MWHISLCTICKTAYEIKQSGQGAFSSEDVCFWIVYLEQRVRALCRLKRQQDEHAELLLHVGQLQDLQPVLRDVIEGKLFHLVHHLDWPGLILTHRKHRQSGNLTTFECTESYFPSFKPNQTVSWEWKFILCNGHHTVHIHQFICKLLSTHLVDFKGHLLGVFLIKAVHPVAFEIDGIDQGQSCHTADCAWLQKIFDLIWKETHKLTTERLFMRATELFFFFFAWMHHRNKHYFMLRWIFLLSVCCSTQLLISTLQSSGAPMKFTAFRSAS